MLEEQVNDLSTLAPEGSEVALHTFSDPGSLQTAFQGLFRNPLVSPDILGASSGAALGAVLGIFLSLGVVGIQLLAFVGGLVAVAGVYAVGASLRTQDPILVLVLAYLLWRALRMRCAR